MFLIIIIEVTLLSITFIVRVACFFIGLVVVGWNCSGLLENFEGLEGGTTLTCMFTLLTCIKETNLALVRDDLYS